MGQMRGETRRHGVEGASVGRALRTEPGGGARLPRLLAFSRWGPARISRSWREEESAPRPQVLSPCGYSASPPDALRKATPSRTP